MGKIFYVMGKSSSGKDTIFQELLKREDLGLKRIVPYTTRPKRCGEKEGVEYHFTDEETLGALLKEGKVIELRAYDTVQGIWKYFTVDDENLDLDRENYLAIGTLVSYGKMKEYFGGEVLFPIYVEVSDYTRLLRAAAREKGQEKPDYSELCRRFLADQEDFCEENLKKAGIARRFQNEGEKSACVEEAAACIKGQI